MNSAVRVSAVLYGLLALLALCLPWLGVYPVFLMKLLCFAMFACAYNLLLGFGRMLSFGHAAFFGFAAYVTSWLVTAHGAEHRTEHCGGGDSARQRQRRSGAVRSHEP